MCLYWDFALDYKESKDIKAFMQVTIIIIIIIIIIILSPLR